MEKNREKYYTHISSKTPWFELKLGEAWKYRDLIILFTKRTFALRYKQTILGPLWLFLNPFLTSFVFTFVFGYVAGMSTDGVPQILFYMTGNALWLFFQECVTRNAATFTSNANVFGKVYFPRLTVPISNVLSAMIEFYIQISMSLCLLAYYIYRGQVHPNWSMWPLLPLVLIHIGLLGVGVGLVISSLTTKYRDLSILVGFGVSLWMYGTPVVYPLSQLEEGLLKTIILMNPVTAPIEVFRYAFLGRGSIIPEGIIFSIIVTIILDIIAVMIFNKVEKTFMDTV